MFSFFLFSDLAFANEWENDPVWMVIKAVNTILIMASAILWATTALASLFLTPEWVNGTLFGLDKYMKEIWILISNIVYFIFAFILITIAFMNIIGKWDKWELKSALPKFIVWVIMVPFTWFFVQFILSISAILTVWVLTLPYDTFESNTDYKASIAEMSKLAWDTSDNLIPTSYILDLSESVKTDEQGDTTVKDAEWFFETGGWKTVEELLLWEGEGGHQNSIFWVLSLYTYGIMQVHKTDHVTGAAISTEIKDLTNLSLKVVFDAVLIIVYLILMITLFLALLVRGIKLWIYAMLSPTFWLLYFFDKADGVGEWQGKFGIKDFISLALVPVYVSAALSFGLLFIMVSSHGMQDWNFLSKCSWEPFNIQWEKAQSAECMKIGWFTFGIKWAHSWNTSWSWDFSWAFWKLIMELFGIVILWIAIMTALKQSEITNKITQPIQEFWWNVWNLIAKSPMYAPIIPTGTWWLSAKWLAQVWSTATSYYESASRETGTDFIKQQWLFGQWIDLSTKSLNALDALKANPDNPLANKQVWDKFKEAFREWRTTSELSSNKNFVNLLQTTLANSWDKDLVELSKSVRVGDQRSVVKWIAALDHLADDKFRTQSWWSLIDTNYKWNYDALTVRELDRLLGWGKSDAEEAEASSETPKWWVDSEAANKPEDNTDDE